MGGKSGGRKAADQVLLTGRQIYERFAWIRVVEKLKSIYEGVI